LKIIIPDDYQNAVTSLNAFDKLTGHKVTVYHDTVRDIDKLAERFQEAEALVLIRERTAISEVLLERLPNLTFISQTGRGIPHIDLAACTRRGIPIAAGGGTPYATAELTWGLLLAAARHIPREVARLKTGRWQSTIGFALRGRTLGIYGYGKIGTLVAGYGKAFGMNVLVWGREGSISRAQADGFTTAASQDDLFQRSDVLSLHIRLAPETYGVITAADLGRMKPSAMLVNTSRAELIAPDALEAALRAGRPGYAAVDVYETEPLTDSPLLHMNNVICTPHLGYVEKDSYERYFGTAFDQILAFAAGKPINIVNPEALKQA
jgi:D-3-phosphoglycerate dehydrogenase / 2-oxoglutarate reductase